MLNLSLLNFVPRHIAEALLSRRELVPENQLFFRAVFTFLLKLVFYLDYKSNRMVFTKSIDKTYNHIPSNSGIPFRNPAIEVFFLNFTSRRPFALHFFIPFMDCLNLSRFATLTVFFKCSNFNVCI